MAEKPTIVIYRKLDTEDFTKALAEPDSKTEIGSGAAMTAAVSASYLHRAAATLLAEKPEDERLVYLERNTEILRAYMVRLIDEDVKCRGPLRRAIKEGDARKIEAARQAGVAIAQEIVYMMGQGLDFSDELAGQVKGWTGSFLAESAELAISAVRACMHYILAMSSQSEDDTYRFVIQRENEVTLGQLQTRFESILVKTGSVLPRAKPE